MSETTVKKAPGKAAAGSEGNSKVGSAIAALVLAGVCGAGGWIAAGIYARSAEKSQSASDAARMAAMAGAAQTVALAEVKEMEYNLPERFLAHAEAMAEVDLLPQVDGYIKEIKFKEGDTVKEGQVLYLMDDEKYQAVVGQAKADLNAAETEARRARRYADRMLKADERGITQLERDNAEAAADKADAAVMQAKANLVVAEYNCKKAKIIAPISGQIGKTSAHVGDYVAPSKGALAHIVQTNPIRVSFPMTDRTFIAWRKSVRDGKQAENRLRLMLPDGTEYDHQGVWDFDDNEMSKTTASIIMRLKFDNPDKILVPGTYLTMFADLKHPPKYPCVPQTAIIDLDGGKVGVYVAQDDGTVKATEVTTLAMHDGFVPVTKGLKAGQKVIASGTRKLHDGAKYTVVEATPNEENTPGWKGKSLD
jgi:membrane fusion protein, multidrug efflux system